MLDSVLGGLCFSRGAARRRRAVSAPVEQLESRRLLTAGPTLVAINLTSPRGSLISATQATFAVTFSDAVTGVTPDDFRVTGDGVTVAETTVAGSGTTYAVTVHGIAGSGSLSIHVVDDRSIRDVEGQPLNLATAPAILAGRQDFTTRESPEAVALSDVNSDGHPDLMAAAGDTVSVLLGGENATFQARQEFQTGAGARAIVVGDVNEDGRVDLVVACIAANAVSLLLGNGDGTFQARQDIPTGAGPVSIALSDLNDDQHIDLVVANSGTDTVSVLLGNGDGTFRVRQDLITSAGPESVTVGDLNGDRRVDLVVANAISGMVSVLLGRGDGTFEPSRDIDTKSVSTSVAVGDLNGDGRADLVVASRDSNRGSVLLGNGDGTFQSKLDFATGSRPRSLELADLNGDGRLDLAVANQSSGAVSILLGNGNGKFQSKQDFKTGSSSIGVAISDVNGDGSLDVAVVNRDSANISVLTGFGNLNGASVAVDQSRPVVMFDSTAANPTNSSPIPVTVKVSETVTGLTASDLLVTGGTVSGFTGGGNAYAFQVTPTGPGVVMIDLSADAALDAAGNGNRAAAQFSRSFGTTTIAPVARHGTLATVAGSSQSGTLVVVDGDSPPANLTISVVSGPTHGSVNINAPQTGAYTYTPDAGFNGSDSFTYRAHDGSQFGNTATVSISVAKLNAPASIIGTGTGLLTEDSSKNVVAGMLTVIDPDDGENVFQTPASLNAIFGTFTINVTTGDWTYALDNLRAVTTTLVAGQQVTDSLEVTSRDGTAKSQIVIHITGTDDPPVIALNAVPLSYRIGSQPVVTLDALATITDPDTPTLEFTGAILKVAGHRSKDALSILKQGAISLKDKNVLFGKTVIGTFAGGAKGQALTIKLKVTATPEAVQALLRGIAFKSTDKAAGTRTLQFQITNIAGRNSNLATRQVKLAK